MASALLYTFGVIVFILAVLLSIALHELGHLTVAKRFGAKVTDYFVGFGPTLWSRKKGETEYGVKAVPLGGFVRIVGMVPPDRRHPDEIRESNTGLFTQVISRARSEDRERIKPEDEDRLFYKLPAWKKFLVMAAGPMVNIALAFFIFLGLFMTYGDRDYQPKDGTPELAVVDECVKAWDDPSNQCVSTDPETPAWAAGLRKGDRVLTFNGERITNWRQMQALIRKNKGDEFTTVVERNGATLTLTGRTVAEVRPMDPKGETLRTVGYMGVTPKYEETIVRGGPIYTAKWMGAQTVEVVKSFRVLPEKVANVALAIVGQQERDPNGPMSVVGGSRFVGETVASDLPEETKVDKLAFVLSLTGAFNLFIGVFNFIPILPLDGGHMAGAMWEGVKRRWARLLHRPDPGPFDIAKLMPVAQLVGLSLFLLGIVLIVGDFVVPISRY